MNPLNKVYALSKPLEQMPLLFAILTIYSFEFMYFSAHASSIMMMDSSKRVDGVSCDGPAFLTGMLTIFKQFHPLNERTFLNIICHFFKNEVFKQGLSGQQPKELTRNASMTLVYLDELIRFKGSKSRETVNQMLGSYIFDTYNR